VRSSAARKGKKGLIAIRLQSVRFHKKRNLSLESPSSEKGGRVVRMQPKKGKGSPISSMSNSLNTKKEREIGPGGQKETDHDVCCIEEEGFELDCSMVRQKKKKEASSAKGTSARAENTGERSGADQKEKDSPEQSR